MSVNKRKAQSEIITTVLIILLVLAAVVIVWQVVSNVIKGGEKDILTQQQCIGLNLEVSSATVPVGTCTYAQDPAPGAAVCTIPVPNPTPGIKNGACSAVTGCTVIWARTSANTGSVTVTRKAGTAKVESITPILLVNGAIDGGAVFTPTTLKTLESSTGSAITNNLKVGDKLKVGAKLPDGTACGESTELTAV
jgi:flagellin-like protein